MTRQSIGHAIFLAVLLVAMGWLTLLLLRDEGPEPIAAESPGDIAEVAAFAEFAPIELGELVPTALAVAPDGCIMVAGAGRLMLLEAPSSSSMDHGNPLVVKEMLDLPEDAHPTCLAVGGDGTVYVGFPARIDAFSPDGTVRTVANFALSAHLTSLAVREASVDPAGSLEEGQTGEACTPIGLFAADAGNRVVCQIRLTDGAILREIGRPNAADPGSGFVVPSPYFDVVLGMDDSLWVVNPGHHRLENYAADGTLRSSWQRIGSALADFCGCCNPIHIAVLPDGSFLTVEKGIPRVKLLGPDGAFRELVAGPEAFDEGTIPGDVAMLPDGRVLGLDPIRRQIRVFQRE